MRRRATAGPIESLESRTLLNATLTSAISPVTVTKDADPTTIDLTAHFNDPVIVGTAVVMHTTQGDIPLTLFDSKTPQTVANFLSYVNPPGEYDGTVIQRAALPYYLQGGQYLPDQSEIPTHGTVQSEAGISNTIGTIAMGLVQNQGPDSATDAWFINLSNNNRPPVNLDDTSNGGPFTVFGTVIYNGMSVVDQIANLPKGIVQPNFVPLSGDPGPVLPLQNYAGGPITPANYVTIPSVQVVPSLAFSATSNNTAVVVPTISNGVLSLNYQPGQAGVATITVNATDLGGHTVTSAFKVAVGTVIGPGGARQIRFTDADGTRTTLSLTGPGSASVQFNGTDITPAPISRAGVMTVTGSGLSIGSIALTGTTAASTFNASGVGGDNQVEIGSITSDGDLRAINAARGAVSGNVTIAGSVGRIQLASATGGTITINGSSGAVTLAIGTATDEAVNSSEAVAAVQGTAWTSSSPVSASLFNAPSVGRFVIRRDLTASVTTGSVGAVNAGSMGLSLWNVSGAIRTVTTGALNHWSTIAGSVGRVTDRGAATLVEIDSAGDLTAFSAASMSGTMIIAGQPTIPPTVPGLVVQTWQIPTGFTSSATIGRLTVGRGGFSDSIIAAPSLGRLNLGAVTSTNGGTTFGLAASTIASLLATIDGKRLSLRNVSSADQVTAALAAAGITANDLVIRIV